VLRVAEYSGVPCHETLVGRAVQARSRVASISKIQFKFTNDILQNINVAIAGGKQCSRKRPLMDYKGSVARIVPTPEATYLLGHHSIDNFV
jgi:hypothetical protein